MKGLLSIVISCSCYISILAAVDPYVRKPLYNAADRARHRLEKAEYNDKRIDKNIMRTLAIIEAKSIEGRVVMLFCATDCVSHREKIPAWISEFNKGTVVAGGVINYHFHRRRNRFGHHGVDAMLAQKPAVVVYFVANKAFPYNGDLDDKDEFVDFLMKLERQPIENPVGWDEINHFISSASACNLSHKYILRIHHPEECHDELWENLVRTFYPSKNVTFIELKRPLTPESTVIVRERLPKLLRKCQTLVVMHNGAYEEITEPMILKDLHERITEFTNEDCLDPQPHSIRGELTDIQLDFLSEELLIQRIEENPTYIVVGTVGGIAVIALAISIFWGLNGTSFVTK
uniref:Thioredoxin domain-containing protein n=1 Tax=Panagrellus redivivus TaxID=6233 RepID=A0A7E4W4K3_PANRE